jgi:hypothetical protein
VPAAERGSSQPGDRDPPRQPEAASRSQHSSQFLHPPASSSPHIAFAGVSIPAPGSNAPIAPSRLVGAKAEWKMQDSLRYS